ncbi:MAG: RNA 2',3'-cyclic phosphodiesterase, partial [Thiotrichales bacterium]|nr:RNA 2',3'-cyclic phosphodiesterase [Thiotrichales bacterium]
HPGVFNLGLDIFGYWSKPAIYWLGVRDVPEQLKTLVKSLRKCARKQGIKVETRTYTPHVTLARKVRVKPETDRTTHIEWPVREFVLVESVPVEDGVEYKMIHRWELET